MVELGIVCGKCERYSPLGTSSCACGNVLSLAELPKVEAPVHRAETQPELPTEGAQAWPPAPPATLLGGVGEVRKATREFVAPDIAKRPASGTLAGVLNDGLRPRASLSPFPRKGSDAKVRAALSVSPESKRPSATSIAARVSLEELMDQAKNYVCKSCSTAVPMGHKFCGRCGAVVPVEIVAARTQFFGQLQTPGKAKLILIRGEGVEGLSYQLNAEHHLVGRNGQLVFPDDPFVSPRHADLFYRDSQLVVRDEGSLNGIYLRVRGTIEIQPGDHFMAGEQVFRVDGPAKATDGPAPDGTYFYSSPKHQSAFRITQLFQGGATGITVCARSSGLQIGREGGDLNFPMDLFMSAAHCRVEEASGNLSLTDLNSRNGTYVRIKNERVLSHGDYIFIGKKLLRVEITAA